MFNLQDIPLSYQIEVFVCTWGDNYCPIPEISNYFEHNFDNTLQITVLVTILDVRTLQISILSFVLESIRIQESFFSCDVSNFILIP